MGTEVSNVSGLVKMREAFPEHHISQLPKPTKTQSQCAANEKRNCSVCGGWHHPKVVHLSYVGHAAITDRLLDADPQWSWEPLAFDPMGLPLFDSTGGLWIKLTVCGVTRLGYGHAESKDHMDAGSREKEVIGDALRNACMRFGAALELWHKGELHPSKEGPEVVQGEFVEAETKQLPEAKEKPPAPGAPASPKANGASAAKPGATASSSKTNGSAQPSVPTTPVEAPKAEAKPKEEKKAPATPSELVEAIPPEKLNGYLTSVMRQMDPPWKYLQIRQFYAEHIDPNFELPIADALDPSMKRRILSKIIEVHKVAPF